MLDKIYIRSPYFVKFLMLNLKALLNIRKRYSPAFKVYLREYKKMWEADEAALQTYQREKLIELLIEAKRHSPYYTGVFEALGLSDRDIRCDPFHVVSTLPILTKKSRKMEVDKLLNTNPARKLTEVGYTSGTSGSPTVNYLDEESIERAFALWKRFHWTIGINKDMKNVRFSGRIIVDPFAKNKPFWVYNVFEKQLMMSSYHLTTENIKHYVDKLNNFKPQFIDGYPSAIYIIARYINNNDISLNFRPQAIATTAETLYDYQRVEMEKAFDTKVFNQYASSEGAPFITECKLGKLHINTDSGYFEFLDTNGMIARPSEIARLVVTSFRNYKTPLIRYDIEDNILLPKEGEVCACGCKMPVIEKIIGREDDVLWTVEKGYVGRMDTAYKGLHGIVKSQIVQESPTDVVINNVVDTTYDEDVQKKLVENLKERLGSNINIKINIVEDIPLGANGKFDAVKRNFVIDDVK